MGCTQIPLAIKPYRDKVSGDPTTGKYNFPVVGRNRLMSLRSKLLLFFFNVSCEWLRGNYLPAILPVTASL